MDETIPHPTVPASIALPPGLQDPAAEPSTVPGLGALQVHDHATVATVIKHHAMIIEHSCPVFGLPLDRLRTADPNLAAMVAATPARHDDLRRLVMGPFTARAAAAWTPRIEQIADDLLHAATFARRGEPGTRFDLVKHLSRPLPTIVMTEILGIIEARRREVAAWAWRFNAGMMGASDVADIAERTDRDVWAWWDGVIDEHRQRMTTGQPVPPGLLTTMLRAQGNDYQVDGRTITADDLVGMCNFLMSAGTATVSAVLATAVLLIADAGLAPRLRAEPKLVERAASECLRLETSFPTMLRYATADVEAGGRTIRKGTVVAANVGAANRDPAVFADPTALCLDRPPAEQAAHLEFGIGAHRCLGAHLAIAELTAGLRALLALPGLRVDALGPRVYPALVPHVASMGVEVVGDGQWTVVSPGGERLPYP